MNIHVLNGINPAAATFLQGTGRIQGNTQRIQGNTQRIQGMSSSELAEFYVSKAMGDVTTLQGIGFFGKKAKARRQERKAARAEKKATRETRKTERRSLRDRRRLARTERQERGEGFFQKAAGALSNFGEAQKIAAEAQVMAAADGVELMPEDFTGAVDFVTREAMMTEDEAQPSFWEQYKVPVIIGGAVVLGGVIYMATKNQGTKKRKR